MNPELGIQLVREGMEAFVEPRTAAAIVFKALTPRSNGLPADLAELSRFVRGPLRQVAESTLGERRAREMVEHVDGTLARLTVAPQELDSYGRDRTLEVELGAGPVFVLVFSGSASLAIALRAAIGGERLGVRAVGDAGSLAQLDPSFPAHLAVVDAVSPPEIDSAGVAAYIKQLPDTCTRLVWGSELPFGATVSNELAKQAVTYTPMSESDGVEPLLDLLRARLG